MEEAARLCDRLVIMEGGRIIAGGTPRDLVEEHVSPEVLEFRAGADVLEGLLPLVEPVAEAVERTGDEVLLVYTQDADTLVARVQESDVRVENVVHRQAGLEDVFLRLTGRSLIE
jgi:lipooligosaccharide transport system ATP-binding protein